MERGNPNLWWVTGKRCQITEQLFIMKSCGHRKSHAECSFLHLGVFLFVCKSGIFDVETSLSWFLWWNGFIVALCLLFDEECRSRSEAMVGARVLKVVSDHYNADYKEVLVGRSITVVKWKELNVFLSRFWVWIWSVVNLMLWTVGEECLIMDLWFFALL
jgi:hypothetical protein